MFSFASKMLNTLIGTEDEQQQQQQASAMQPQHLQMGSGPRMMGGPMSGAGGPMGGMMGVQPRPQGMMGGRGGPIMGGPRGGGSPMLGGTRGPSVMARGGMMQPRMNGPQGGGSPVRMMGPRPPMGSSGRGVVMGGMGGLPPGSNFSDPSSMMLQGQMRRDVLQHQQPPAQQQQQIAAAGEADIPKVDLSHLSDEERAMIESVMAKAKEMDKPEPSVAPPFAHNTNQSQQQTSSQQQIQQHLSTHQSMQVDQQTPNKQQLPQAPASQQQFAPQDQQQQQITHSTLQKQSFQQQQMQQATTQLCQDQPRTRTDLDSQASRDALANRSPYLQEQRGRQSSWDEPQHSQLSNAEDRPDRAREYPLATLPAGKSTLLSNDASSTEWRTTPPPEQSKEIIISDDQVKYNEDKKESTTNDFKYEWEVPKLNFNTYESKVIEEKNEKKEEAPIVTVSNTSLDENATQSDDDAPSIPFLDHSPGEVYTIPEEEEEAASPTGGDGVTSLRRRGGDEFHTTRSSYLEMSGRSSSRDESFISDSTGLPSSQFRMSQNELLSRSSPKSMIDFDRSRLRGMQKEGSLDGSKSYSCDVMSPTSLLSDQHKMKGDFMQQQRTQQRNKEIEQENIQKQLNLLQMKQQMQKQDQQMQDLQMQDQYNQQQGGAFNMQSQTQQGMQLGMQSSMQGNMQSGLQNNMQQSAGLSQQMMSGVQSNLGTNTQMGQGTDIQSGLQSSLSQQNSLQQQNSLVQSQYQQQNQFQQSGMQQSGMQETGMQGTGIQQTGMQGTGMQQIGMQGTGMQQTGMQGTGIQQTGMQGTGIQQTGMQGTGMQQTGMQGTGMQQTGMQGTGMQQTGMQGTGMQQTGMQGTGMQQTGMQSTGLQGTGLQGIGMHGTGMPGTGLQQTGMQGTGMQPTGMQGTGLQQTGMQQTGLQQTNMPLQMQQQNTMQQNPLQANLQQYQQASNLNQMQQTNVQQNQYQSQNQNNTSMSSQMLGSTYPQQQGAFAQQISPQTQQQAMGVQQTNSFQRNLHFQNNGQATKPSRLKLMELREGEAAFMNHVQNKHQQGMHDPQGNQQQNKSTTGTISGMLADFSRALGLGSTSPRPSPSEDKNMQLGSASQTQQQVSPYPQSDSGPNQYNRMQMLQTQQQQQQQQLMGGPQQQLSGSQYNQASLVGMSQATSVSSAAAALGQQLYQQSQPQLTYQDQASLLNMQGRTIASIFDAGQQQMVPLSQAQQVTLTHDPRSTTLHGMPVTLIQPSQGSNQQSAHIVLTSCQHLTPQQQQMYQQQMQLQHQAQHLKKIRRSLPHSSEQAQAQLQQVQQMRQKVVQRKDGILGSVTSHHSILSQPIMSSSLAGVTSSVILHQADGTPFVTPQGTPAGTPRSTRDTGGDSSDTLSETDSQKSLRMRRKLPPTPLDPLESTRSTKKRERSKSQPLQDRYRSYSPLRHTLDRTGFTSSLSMARPSASETNLRSIAMGGVELDNRPGSALGLLQVSSVVSSTGLRTTTSGMATSDLTTTTSVLPSLYSSSRTSSSLADLASCLPPNLRHLLGPSVGNLGASSLPSESKYSKQLPTYLQSLKDQLREEIKSATSDRRRLMSLTDKDARLRWEREKFVASMDPMKRFEMEKKLNSPMLSSHLRNRKLRGHRRQLSDPKIYPSISSIKKDGDLESKYERDYYGYLHPSLKPPHKSYELESLDDPVRRTEWDPSQSYLASSYAAAGGALRETAINSVLDDEPEMWNHYMSSSRDAWIQGLRSDLSRSRAYYRRGLYRSRYHQVSSFHS